MTTDYKDFNKIQKAKNEITEIKGVMINNIELILQRGEKIDNLHNKAHELEQQSVSFHRNSQSLKKRMWWRNAKLFAILIIIIVIIIIIIYFGIHGFK